MDQTLDEEAWGLFHSIATECDSHDGFGSMSPTAYDTAWVAMIQRKDEDGISRPLFPEAYVYLKQSQTDNGSWASDTSDADGIVNTLAALLALRRQDCQDTKIRADNERRCTAAEDSLRQMLSTWNLEAADRVGLEVLIPNMLLLMEAEGTRFEFPARDTLMELNKAKLARLGPMLTSTVQTTLIHTLEAFVGTLNFDKVEHHKMPNGSLLASPSSTAAYLMNASQWDASAEAYLRMVFEHKAAIGQTGGFPSAFPSTLFETSWIVDLLLSSGFVKEDFLLADRRKLTVLLEDSLKAQNGTVGFAPAALPDADDTAKTISALHLLGWDKDVGAMLHAFERDTYFITYSGERNASSSANCNVLACLLKIPEPAKYTKQIVKCVKFLSRSWMANDGPDKWHVSVHYPMMLIAQTFSLFLKRWSDGDLDEDAIPRSLVTQHIPRILLGILAQIIKLQHIDGSWETKREVTAYAVLTLGSLLSLPWIEFVRHEGIACMYRGKAYLESHRSQWKNAEKLWIEKTVYSSSNLSQAYCIAASKICIPAMIGSSKLAAIFPVASRVKAAKMCDFFSGIGLFRDEPKWQLYLSLLQSATYGMALKDWRHTIFPSIKKANDEKYQDYIPFTWIGCRDLLSTPVRAESLWDMMTISLLGFQVDAYMETVILEQYHANLPALKDLIRRMCTGTRSHCGPSQVDDARGPSKRQSVGTHGLSNRHSNGSADGRSDTTNGISMAKDTKQGNLKNYSRDIGGDENGNTELHDTQRAVRAVNELRPKRTDPYAVEPRISSATDADQSHREGNTISVPLGPKTDTASAMSTNALLGGNSGKPDARGGIDVPGEDVLQKFVNFVLAHPRVAQAGPSLRAWLAYEVQTYLIAHITHLEDCLALAQSSDLDKFPYTWAEPRTTFFTWVRSTSADLTSCCYAFVFFLCLIGDTDRSLAVDVQQRYMLEDACRHLATLCRQYNDMGSLARDSDERNLNSINFPEFDDGLRDVRSNDPSQVRGEKLLVIAEYERRCLTHVLAELEGSLTASTLGKLKLFVQVTDLYGQIYVAQDIGIRVNASRT